MVCLSLRACSLRKPVPSSRTPPGEALEAHEVLAGDEVLGRIERYDPSTTRMGSYCWVASSRGTRSWWFSRAGAIARVVETNAIAVAQQLLDGQSTE